MKAYISASNKENIELLAKNLQDKKYEIFAPKETYKYLKEKNINVIESPIEKALDDNFDVVAINLNSFEEYLDKNIDEQTLIENINIEEIALLRASAKNYENTIVISSDKDYNIDLDDITLEKRQELALSAFLTTSKYDFLVNKKLSKEFKIKNNEQAYYFNKLQNLRYGENPHQSASLYSYKKELDWNLLNGKEMSYNNFLDATVALEIVAEFFDVSAIAVVKHSNPCAVALASNIEQAFDKTLDSDPISPFKSTVATTKEITLSLAKKLRPMNLEVIIAPSYNSEALEELKKNKNLRILKINTPLCEILKFQDEEIKLTPFGALIQEKNNKDLDIKTFKVMTKKKPEQSELEDMIFAHKVAKHAKSNAIVVAKDLRTIGICTGQPNKIDALEVALNRVCDSNKEAVVATDGTLETAESILIMAQNRISSVIQVAKSTKDAEIAKLADKYNISMISTGIRHYKH